MRRRTFLKQGSAAAIAVLTGCGGGSADSAGPSASVQPAPAAPVLPSLSPSPPAPPASSANSGPTPTPAPAATGGLPTLTLYPTYAGTLPYLATAYPLEGAVPAGQVVLSDDDASLRSTVLSLWEDGSAKVVVMAGVRMFTDTTSVTMRLKSGIQTGASVSASRVQALIEQIVVDTDAYGAATFTRSDLGSPEFAWWSSPAVGCFRYRKPIGADPTLEAVIDIHAFANTDRALIEIVVENGKLDPTNISTPAAKTYTATVSVQPVAGALTKIGDPIGNGLNGTHEPFRAWFRGAWVSGSTASAEGGAADPQVEVTHDTAYLGAHPLFYATATPTTTTGFDNFATPIYAPWTNIWHGTDLSGTGEGGRHGLPADLATWIGPFSGWNSAYLTTGDRRARKASIVAGLETLKFNVNHRSTATGLVISSSECSGRSGRTGTWPRTTTLPSAEVAHSYSVGPVEFLCRPSPIFIECAQKLLVWHQAGDWRGYGSNPTGGHPSDQVRARAWRMRDYGNAIFVTPELASGLSTWKTEAQSMAATAIQYEFNLYRNYAPNTLDIVWDLDPTGALAVAWSGKPGLSTQALWMHHWCAVVAHCIDKAKVLTGTAGTRMSELADWLCRQPVRWINDSTDGGWRSMAEYYTIVGTQPRETSTMTFYSDNWQTVRNTVHSGVPPTEKGGFIGFADLAGAWSTAVEGSLMSSTYLQCFWSALVAATERDILGASAAFNRVRRTITDFESVSRPSLSKSPRYNRWPRNVT